MSQEEELSPQAELASISVPWRGEHKPEGVQKPPSGYGEGPIRRVLASDDGSIFKPASLKAPRKPLRNPFNSNDSLDSAAISHAPTFSATNPFDIHEVLHESQPSGYFNAERRVDPIKVYGSLSPQMTERQRSRSRGAVARDPLLERLDRMHLGARFGDDSMITKEDVSNITGSVFNVVKNTLGCGILTVPWAFAEMGLIPGLVFYCLSLVTSFASWIVIALCSQKVSRFTYGGLVRAVLGQRHGSLVDFMLFCMLCLVGVSYCVFLCDFLLSALSFFGVESSAHLIVGSAGIPGVNDDILKSTGNFVTSRFFLETILVFGVMIPASFKTDLRSLTYTSVFGLLCVAYVFILVLIYWVTISQSRGYWIHESVTLYEFRPVVKSMSGESLSSGPMAQWYMAWMQVFAVLFATFCSHFNAPKFYGALSNRSIGRWVYMSSLSYFVMVAMSLILGLAGYLTFGAAVNDSITISLPSKSVAVGIAQLSMTVNLLMTYPLIFMALKDCLHNLVFRKHQHACAKYGASKWNRLLGHKQTAAATHVLLQVCFWIVSVNISEVGQVLALTMSLLGLPIQFVVPGLMYLRLTATESKAKAQAFCDRFWGHFLIVFGALSSMGGVAACVVSFFYF